MTEDTDLTDLAADVASRYAAAYAAATTDAERDAIYERGMAELLSHIEFEIEWEFVDACPIPDDPYWTTRPDDYDDPSWFYDDVNECWARCTCGGLAGPTGICECDPETDWEYSTVRRTPSCAEIASESADINHGEGRGNPPLPPTRKETP